ncbi:MAG: M1 family metallopeptidase [Gemmatimonadaceae bacterium]|nr:M1 family metallopeptidase [Gemmatimonadaceae bacterium]
MLSAARISALLVILALAPASAQGTGGTVATLVYQPGIDVRDYDIRIELPDTGAFIRGDVTVTARRAAGVSTLLLDLVDALTVRGIEVNGRAVGPVHANGKVEVPLGGATGDSVSVRVRYDGRVTDGLVVLKDAQGRWTWFGDNWPDRARQWLPTVDHPSDKATVSWTVRAPVNRTIVANGTLLGVRDVGGPRERRSETRWREALPISTYLMVIGAGPLVNVPLATTGCTQPDPARCLPQSVYVMPEHREWLPGPFAAAAPIVSYFETLVGPFPYEKLAHVQSATRFGGMENATAIFYAYDLFTTRRMSVGLIAHETAHQWFGDSVTEREWAHLWLSEGFATYFAALWTRKASGDSAFRAEMARIRTQVLADSVVASRPVIDTAQTNYLALLNANSYQKGGYVLYMLNQQIGDSAFFRGVRSYQARFRHGTALSDDLRIELERSSGRPLGPFFDQWLRRPGVAQPNIGWAHDVATGTISLLVLQDSVRGAYEVPLTVRVTERSGAQRRVDVVVPADARATVTLPGRFDSAPASLDFDPAQVLLARIGRP